MAKKVLRKKSATGVVASSTAKKKAPAKAKKQYTIGIDLGGTKVAAALVDDQGVIVSEVSRQTAPEGFMRAYATNSEPSAAEVKRHIGYVIESMADAALEVMEGYKQSDILGIGFASAGPMTIDKGTLDNPSNFRGWKTVPVVDLLSKSLAKKGLKKSITFQNDAIAAALGEGWTGRARGCQTYAMITVGTGIGSGVIFNGLPAQSQGMGSEWGHMLVNTVGFGKDTERFASRTVEGIASGTGLRIRARERGMGDLSTRDLANMAHSGDKKALQLFEEAAEALASLLFSLSLGFHPEKFVFSGGMIEVRELFLPRTIEIYNDAIKRKGPKFLAPVQVAQLGVKAGVIGAARLPYL